MRMKKGFSLIELLVVIAIIGILAGMVLMVAYQAKQKARVAAGKGMLSSIPAAMALCRYGGGILQEPLNEPLGIGGNYICDDPSITDARFPDLTGSGWFYLGLSPNEADTAVLYAACNGPQCREKTFEPGKTYMAECFFDKLQRSQTGCDFYYFP